MDYISHIKNIGGISSRIFEEAVRIILSLLIISILITILWAALKTLLMLKVVFNQNIHDALKIVKVQREKEASSVLDSRLHL